MEEVPAAAMEEVSRAVVSVESYVPWWDMAHMDTAHGNAQHHFPAQRDTSAGGEGPGLLSTLLCHGQQSPIHHSAVGEDTSSACPTTHPKFMSPGGQI